MSKGTSRPKRWADAVARATAARSQVEDAVAMYNTAISDLQELQAEYEDWRARLPENLSGSALADKLDTVVSISFEELEPDFSELEEAENVELPRGFGRD